MKHGLINQGHIPIHVALMVLTLDFPEDYLVKFSISLLDACLELSYML